MRGKSDVRRVFIACGGDEEMKVTVIGPVRRGMSRAGIVLAPPKNFLALFGRKLPPEVTRLGHVSGMESRLQPVSHPPDPACL